MQPRSEKTNGSRNGFALLAALLVTLVLMALGVLVFTMTTGDYRVSVKIHSEKQALFAAESGVHNLMTTFSPAQPANSLQADQAVAGNTQYTYMISKTFDEKSRTERDLTSGFGPDMRALPGDEANLFFTVRYSFDVTGRDKVTGNSVQLNVGMGYGPVAINQ